MPGHHTDNWPRSKIYKVQLDKHNKVELASPVSSRSQYRNTTQLMSERTSSSADARHPARTSAQSQPTKFTALRNCARSPAPGPVNNTDAAPAAATASQNAHLFDAAGLPPTGRGGSPGASSASTLLGCRGPSREGEWRQARKGSGTDLVRWVTDTQSEFVDPGCVHASVRWISRNGVGEERRSCIPAWVIKGDAEMGELVECVLACVVSVYLES